MNSNRASAKKLLVVAPEAEARYFLGRILDRSVLEASRIDTGQECLEASARESYSLIVVRIPLADLSVSALATGLTQRFSLNADTPLLMLAEGKQYEAALGYCSSRIRVVDVNGPSTNIEGTVTAALGIALRAAARLEVELAVETGQSQHRRHCRTRDISRSGMLLEGDLPFPVGTEFAFNFTLPERFTPIHGRAQVVRRAAELEDTTSGVGVRFLDFPEGAEEAIGAFVNQNRLWAR